MRTTERARNIESFTPPIITDPSPRLPARARRPSRGRRCTAQPEPVFQAAAAGGTRFRPVGTVCPPAAGHAHGRDPDPGDVGQRLLRHRRNGRRRRGDRLGHRRAGARSTGGPEGPAARSAGRGNCQRPRRAGADRRSLRGRAGRRISCGSAGRRCCLRSQLPAGRAAGAGSVDGPDVPWQPGGQRQRPGYCTLLREYC